MAKSQKHKTRKHSHYLCVLLIGPFFLFLFFFLSLFQIVEFLINKKTVEINSQNYEGLTALGILDQAGSIDKFPHIKAMLERASGINMKILSSKEVEGTNPGVFEDTWRPIKLDNVSRLPITKDFGDPPNQGNYEVNTLHHQVEETDKIQEDNSSMPDHSPKKTTSSLANLQRHKLLSRR